MSFHRISVWMLLFPSVIITSCPAVAAAAAGAEHLQPPADHVLIPHRDATMPAVPARADRDRGFQLFRRHWMDVVYASTVPSRRTPVTSLETFASPGEYEPVAFGMHALRDLNDLRLTATPLVCDAGGTLPAPELRVARQMLAMVRHLPPPQVIAVPVVLEKRASHAIPGRTSAYCWVTVHVPGEVPAGMYHGQITVAVQGRNAATIPLNVQVLPVDLLSSNRLDQSYGFWLWHFEQPQPYAPVPADAFMDMAEHGFNSAAFTTDQRVDFVKADDGYDRPLEGKNWDIFMKAAKAAGFARPSLVHTDDIARDAARLFPYTDGMEGKAYKLKPNADFERLFCQGIDQIIGEFRRRSLPEPIFGIADEMQLWEQYTHGYLDALIHRAGGKTFANGVSPHPADSQAWQAKAIKMTDVIVAGCTLRDYHGRYLQGFPESVVLAEQQGKRMMNYNFGSMQLPVPAQWRFGMGWYFESLGKGSHGQFVHAYYAIYDDPYNFLDYNGYGERSVVFPAIPERNEVGGPTINYEAMREGIDDMRYITTLKRLIARARQAGLAVAAEDARHVLDAIAGSFDFSAFYAMARDYKELTPGLSLWQRTSPPFDAVASAKVTETWPQPLNYIEGGMVYPNGWSIHEYDSARWAIAEEIIKLQERTR